MRRITPFSITLAPAALAAALGGCGTINSAAGEVQGFGAQAYGQVADLGGAAAAAAHRAASPPPLAEVGDPSSLAGQGVRAFPSPVSAAASQTAPNSLWRPGSRTFFNDQRAQDIGDILTVNIQIADSAEVTNSSSRTRSGSTAVGVNAFFGLENAPGALLPGGYNPGSLIDAEGSSTAQGQGSINREEQIEMTVAVVIVDILPNGNLVIAGRQQVLINAELRELTVSGVIRPEDIAATNTIRHDQIAEARIAYGGAGQVTAVQRPRSLQRLADAISPW
ncbi:MAG: flagellar basal body L-ring protein FlgH [Alphaproteobacteria bacterium]|nr:flagellar basal body L-ring protein FlgH [Alphaproteobacteria bacterium]